jgi:UDPglucose 6-dehydrogenase
MRVCVAGLWHLGVVTAACVANTGHEVIGFDESGAVVSRLQEGIPSLFEPGLEELVRDGIRSGRLRFTNDREAALRGADVLWIAYDIQVDSHGGVEVADLVEEARVLIGRLDPATVTLVSSQVPVGTTRRLEQQRPGDAPVAYVPENLRLGTAIRDFRESERIVVGTRPGSDKSIFAELLTPYCQRIVWMGVESAELTKHALNAFLATCITFANEVAVIGARIGADPREVEEGLKSDSRIGPRGYLRPGAAFSGGTLARDIDFLTTVADRESLPVQLLRGVRLSNDEHARWPLRAAAMLLGKPIAPEELTDHTVAIWGLVYKVGTDTLRGSSSIELCREFARAGARVQAHDVVVGRLPADLSRVITLCPTPLEATVDASLLVVATPWPDYREIDPANVVAAMRTPNVVDADGLLRMTVGTCPSVRYFTVSEAVE